MTLNRRQFLQMLGVAGAAAVLPIELTGNAIQHRRCIIFVYGTYNGHLSLEHAED